MAAKMTGVASNHRLRALPLLVALLAGCGESGTPESERGPRPAACAGRFAVDSEGSVESDELSEISGIEMSATNPGVLWAHNDASGGRSVFAMTTGGRHLGRFTLGGATNVDWEDIALGPGPAPGVSYLYVADTGDNERARASVVVYRVAEPEVDVADPPRRRRLDDVEAFVLRFPDGAQNGETLIVDPNTGDLVVVTKEDSGFARVYGLTAPIADGTLTEHARLKLSPGMGPKVSGGDVAPDGSGVVLRTYTTVLVFARLPGAQLAEALRSAPCTVPSPSEPLAEAIAVTPEGDGYVTVSEGAHPPVNLITAGEPGAGADMPRTTPTSRTLRS